MHAAIRPYFTTGVAIVGAGVIAVSPLIVAPDTLHLPKMAAVQQTVAHETQLLSFGVLLPAAEALMSAFADVSGGLTGAGDTFLNGLADQIAGGANVVNEGLTGGAHLLAAGLVGGVDLVTSGAGAGAEMLTQIIQGLAVAMGEFTMGADGSLPGPGDLRAAVADVFGGFAGAGGTLLGGLSDQIQGGTAVLTESLSGGAHLLATGMLVGISLIASGAATGADSLSQIVQSLADAVGVFGTVGSASASAALPGPAAILAAASGISAGLTGAGVTFLNGLGDQITGGTALVNHELNGGAQLLAGGLVHGTGLLTAGAATGAESMVQVVNGVANAAAELAPGGSSSAAVALPGAGSVIAAGADVSGGLAGAGKTFLNGVSDEITGGTQMVNHELSGGAALAASGIVGGTGLLTAGATTGAHAAGQAVGGLADGVSQLSPGGASAGTARDESTHASTPVGAAQVSESGKKSDGGGKKSAADAPSASSSHGSSDKSGASSSGRGARHAQK